VALDGGAPAGSWALGLVASRPRQFRAPPTLAGGAAAGSSALGLAALDGGGGAPDGSSALGLVALGGGAPVGSSALGLVALDGGALAGSSALGLVALGGGAPAGSSALGVEACGNACTMMGALPGNQPTLFGVSFGRSCRLLNMKTTSPGAAPWRLAQAAIMRTRGVTSRMLKSVRDKPGPITITWTLASSGGCGAWSIRAQTVIGPRCGVQPQPAGVSSGCSLRPSNSRISEEIGGGSVPCVSHQADISFWNAEVGRILKSMQLCIPRVLTCTRTRPSKGGALGAVGSLGSMVSLGTMVSLVSLGSLGSVDALAILGSLASLGSLGSVPSSIGLATWLAWCAAAEAGARVSFTRFLVGTSARKEARNMTSSLADQANVSAVSSGRTSRPQTLKTTCSGVRPWLPHQTLVTLEKGTPSFTLKDCGKGVASSGSAGLDSSRE